MQALTFVLAFVAVLALIGVAAWLVRRFAGNRLGANTNRGRMPRLAVIDAAAVDGRRRLVLVRRDNIEHLLMIGGPTDIVVEPNIVRATSARDPMPQRPPVVGGIEAQSPRIVPLPDAIARLQGLVMGVLPGKPFTLDNFRSLSVDAVCRADGCRRLGIIPQPMLAVLPAYL